LDDETKDKPRRRVDCSSELLSRSSLHLVDIAYRSSGFAESMAVMKLPDPSWPLTFVCAGSVLILAPLPSPKCIYGSVVMSLLILCLNLRFRSVLAHWARAALALLCIAAVLAASSAYAGHNSDLVFRMQSLRLARLLLGLLAGAVIAAFWEPKAILAVSDRLHAPRTVSYVLLASMDSFTRVKSLGSREVVLLSLKDLNKGIMGRLRAYYRVVLPLTVVLLKRQLAHAESLEYRGFFEGAQSSPVLPCSPRMWRLPGALIANALLWWGVCLWL
jgi:hypothetical protein